MSNETVTYSLEAVLTRIEGKIDSLQKDFNQKFDKIDERLNKLEVGQAKLTEKVEGIDHRLKSVEGTQKNQVWTLIILLASAIATAGWKVFFQVIPRINLWLLVTVSSFVNPEKRCSQITSNWFSLKIVPDSGQRKYI
jgi:hypothetical protein